MQRDPGISEEIYSSEILVKKISWLQYILSKVETSVLQRHSQQTAAGSRLLLFPRLHPITDQHGKENPCTSLYQMKKNPGAH